ncbi:putative Serine carboxypeptidase [Melia azedarach]|uniref:Serine carboxypeptidase n=1 Tax=Melia azedarach TaxID=155640 RepID=A0ACC1WRT7_MELAZ|nr:putative Serine carboxypeptidase [Melia azedarach]
MAKLKSVAKLSVSFLLLLCMQLLAASRSIIKFLPGFQGSLPFELETGYVGVGESEESQLFYYFVKSERNPEEDPLLLWLTGGPGCSAFSALAYEIGPINFNVVEYNGSLPTLHLNPYSWTTEASILFVDLPVGTGFSYARTPLASQRGDFKQVHQADQFLKEWLMDHPEFLINPVYIGGDSYSGIIVPPLVQQISNENEEDIKPLINLQSLKRNCAEDYVNVDPSNEDCSNDIRAYSELTSGIEKAHILEPKFVDPEPPLPTIGCRTNGYLLAHYWVNNYNVRKALHIRQRSIGEWHRCNRGLPYTKEITNSFAYHVNLSTKGYRALIYSGDHDMLVPFLGTQEWIRSLNYSIVDDWRPWTLHGQVGGYTRTYSNRMTFATVKGGGHTAPEYRPAECHAMFKRWINHVPL